MNRILWVDALNIFAAMGVLLLHCTDRQFYDFNGSLDFDYWFSIFSHSFFIWPVDVFYMLTGYTLLRKNLISSPDGNGMKKFYNRRCSRILIPVIFWNMAYTIIGIRRVLRAGGTINLWECITMSLQLKFNITMWFFIPLIAIYICLPFFNVLMHNLNRTQLKWFLWIGFSLVSIVPFLNAYTDITKFDNMFPLGSNYLIFAGAGYYFGNYDISHSTRYRFYCLSIISAIVIASYSAIAVASNFDHIYKVLFILVHDKS